MEISRRTGMPVLPGSVAEMPLEWADALADMMMADLEQPTEFQRGGVDMDSQTYRDLTGQA